MSRRQLQEQEILKPKFPHVLLPENWKSFKKTLKHEWEWTEVFTARKRSLGQGNIFAPVCHSVHRGGGEYLGRYPSGRYNPQAGTTPRQVHPLGQGSHSDWKTWKNEKAFSSQGKVREF